MIAGRQLKIQPVLMLASVAITAGLGWILTGRLGLLGAAVAVLCSSLFQLAANLAVTLRALDRMRASAPAGRPA
jgi:O-antigen/teichoic acid export membrane protein